MHRFQLIAILLISESIISLVLSKRINVQDSDEKDFQHAYLLKLFGAISRAKGNIQSNRRNDDRNSQQMRYLYKTLSNTMDDEYFKDWLQREATVKKEVRVNLKDELLAGLVEQELLDTLSKKASLRLEKPYVQKKGRNDFLVIGSDLTDPFVTVVPNDIYYGAEKKCVNWLEDCNQKGLRDRLLQKVHGPYK